MSERNEPDAALLTLIMRPEEDMSFIVRNSDSWRLASLVQHLPHGEVLVQINDHHEVWPISYVQTVALRGKDHHLYEDFLATMLDAANEDTGLRP